MRLLGIYLLLVLLISCGKKKAAAPAPVVAVPAAATLTSPSQNEACTSGIIVSSTESRVTLIWSASANTDSYEVTLKNLLTGNSVNLSSSTTSLETSLLRNTPYSWQVTSKSTKTSSTAKSDTWKFYNSGPGAVSYAPFPAEMVSPTNNQAITATAGKITLDWNGSDADNDITVYDVYFGTSSSPALLQADVSASVLSNVTVSNGTTYYWKVITKDAKGNSSDSGIYKFTTN